MTKSPSLSVEVLHNVATLTGALLFYYYFPVTGEASALWQLLLFGVGLLLIWWIIRELMKQLAAGSNGVSSRVQILLAQRVADPERAAEQEG